MQKSAFGNEMRPFTKGDGKAAFSMLKEGFTTGTAAAAAAHAATLLLFGFPLPRSVSVPLPPFPDNGYASRQSRLSVPVEDGGLSGETAFASVIKDGGDDPDVTHGARITVTAAHMPFANTRHRVFGPVRAAGRTENILLYGGEGVGVATLPGLPVQVGEPAINPEPRRQITAAVLEALRAVTNGRTSATPTTPDTPEMPRTSGTPGTNRYASGKDTPAPAPGRPEKNRENPVHILISVAGGENLAQRTMNPRLGVIGGISILGTRGIVKPYSHEAWTKTIEQSLDVAAALGSRKILVSTGRRSARLGLALYPRLAEQSCIQAADYAAFTLRAAAGKNFFTHLFWVCFPGKLLKLAQGLENTHAGKGSSDLALVADICRAEGADVALEGCLRASPTLSAALTLLDDEPKLLFAILTRLGQDAFAVMEEWLASARPSSSSLPELRLHVFSTDERLLLTIPDPGGYGND